MTDDELDALVTALMAKIKAEQPGVSFGQGTIMAVPLGADTTLGSSVWVQMDGDAAQGVVTPHEVQSLVGNPEPGQRGVVVFTPPRGAYLVGILAPPATGGCTPNTWIFYPEDELVPGSTGPLLIPFTQTEIDSGSAVAPDTTITGAIMIHEAGDWEVTIGVAWSGFNQSAQYHFYANFGALPFFLADTRVGRVNTTGSPVFQTYATAGPRTIHIGDADAGVTAISVFANIPNVGGTILVDSGSGWGSNTYIQIERKCTAPTSGA